MRKLLSRLSSTTVLFYIFVAIAQFAHAVYMATGAWEPNPTFSFIYAMGFLWILASWLSADSRKRGIKLVYDMGLVLYIVWPFFMPYYLIKTRGSKGLLVILGFLAVCAAARFMGLAFYLAALSKY